jgi:sulfite exporter TauE/SafE
MEYVWMALVGGAAAFPHCLGMCGGFALHLAGPERRRTVFARQVLWHLGRTTTYVFLGALAGFLGRMVSVAQSPALRDIPGYFAGALMVLMGLAVLGVFPTRRRPAAHGQDEGLFTVFFRQFFHKPSSLSALVLGLATGFLPCPISVGFLGLAAGTASVPLAMAIMAAMGAGTVWSLLILGLTGQAVRAKWKSRGAVFVGVVLLLMGTWTVLRKAKVLPPIPGLVTWHSHR